jgi:glycosyltransferase involved in cell wall biosynthesis
MRILSVTQSYAPFFEFGGPPVKVRALAEGLARKGHEVTVLTADWGLDQRLREHPASAPAENSPFGRKRKMNGTTVIYLPNWLHYRATSWNPALPRYLRARLGEFDVVHIVGLYHLLGVRVAAACRARHIPYVMEPIGMFVPIVRSLWLKRMYHKLYGRDLFAGASAVIATAEQERAELLAGGIPDEKLVLRRNGVDGPETIPVPGAFRKPLEIPQDTKLVLFLGRLSRKKSPDLLLNAFANVVRKGEADVGRTHLAFVGPDESGMLANLQQLTAKLSLKNQVHFSGALEGEAKWAAYQDADIFVLPSQNENFGNTAAEAVAVGTPVIVTDQCGIAPLLKDVAGMVVKHDEFELAEAMRNLLGNPSLYQKLREGCTSAFQSLGWEQPLTDMEALFCRLAAAGKS